MMLVARYLCLGRDPGRGISGAGEGESLLRCETPMGRLVKQDRRVGRREVDEGGSAGDVLGPKWFEGERGLQGWGQRRLHQKAKRDRRDASEARHLNSDAM